MTTEDIRLEFKKAGLSYSNIGSREIASLIKILNKELKLHDNGMCMKIDTLKSKNVSYDNEGSIEKCFIRVSGRYFNDREAISFNSDGFIGFAGWSDSENIKPFTKAFIRFMDQYKLIVTTNNTTC